MLSSLKMRIFVNVMILDEKRVHITHACLINIENGGNWPTLSPECLLQIVDSSLKIFAHLTKSFFLHLHLGPLNRIWISRREMGNGKARVHQKIIRMCLDIRINYVQSCPVLFMYVRLPHCWMQLTYFKGDKTFSCQKKKKAVQKKCEFRFKCSWVLSAVLSPFR